MFKCNTLLPWSSVTKPKGRVRCFHMFSADFYFCTKERISDWQNPRERGVNKHNKHKFWLKCQSCETKISNTNISARPWTHIPLNIIRRGLSDGRVVYNFKKMFTKRIRLPPDIQRFYNWSAQCHFNLTGQPKPSNKQKQMKQNSFLSAE